MLSRRLKLIPLVALALLLALSATSATAQRGTGVRLRPEKATWSWQFVNATVVNPGLTSSEPEGLLTANYIVEGDALALADGTPVSQGRFQLVLTAFQPRRNLPGQRAGRWHLSGAWTITDVNATAQQLRARHSAAVVKGTLDAVLTFNPLASPQAFEAKTRIPKSLTGGYWAKGRGAVSLDAQFAGTFSVDVRFNGRQP